MLFDTKFDLVISLGEFCACSQYLRKYRLQDYSYPFDWLNRANFSTRIDLLVNNFKDFMEINNLHKMNDSTTNLDDKEHDYYYEDKYNFNLLHDFRTGEDFCTEYENVKCKYFRRINRMYTLISQSNNILFVWYGSTNFPDKDTVLSGYNRLVQKFSGKSIYLLIIEHSENSKEEIFLADSHILIMKYYTLIKGTLLGCEKNNCKVFSMIRKKRCLKWYLKFFIYKFIRIIIEIIPFRILRISLKGKVKRRFKL